MRLQPRRLFWRISAVVLSILVLAVVVPLVLTSRAHSRQLREELRGRALNTARTASLLASDLVTSGDTEALSRLVSTLVHEDPFLNAAYVVDRGGRVLAHSRAQAEGMLLPDFNVPREQAGAIVLRPDHLSRLLLAFAPVSVGGETWATFCVEAPLDPIQGEIRSAILRSILFGAALLLIAGVGAAWVARSIARPIELLAAASQEVARGNFSVRVRIQSRDEIGDLARVFDQMTEELGNALNALRQQSSALEARISEKTEQLARSEARARAMLAASVDAVLTFDEEGRVESLSPAAESLFANSSFEIVGRNVREMLRPIQDTTEPGSRPLLGKGQGEPVAYRQQLIGKKSDGAEFPVELSAAEIKQGDRLLFVAALRDLSERKRLEDETRRLRRELETRAPVPS